MNIKTHPLVLKYLDEITKDIRDLHKKNEIREEILGHIEDKLEAKLGLDHPTDLDIELALSTMDEAAHFQAGLIKVHQPVRSFVTRYIGYAVFVGFICTAFYTEWVFQQAEQNIAEMEKKRNLHLQEFLDDLRVLKNQKFISEIGSGRDAGSFLNGKIPYEDNGRIIKNYKPEITQFEEDERITFDKDFSVLKGAEHVTDIWKKYDLSWMSQLHEFDHWDYTKSGPLQRALDENIIAIYQFPIPNYTQLRFLARLRLAKGFAEKKPLQALKDYRKLAQLIYSNETLVSGMVALGMLKDERKAYEYAVQKKLLSEQDYAVISLDEIERLRRATWAAGAFTYYLVDHNIMMRVLEQAGPSSVICAGVWEGFAGNLNMRPFFEDSLIIEHDFTENEKNMQTLLEQTPQCRLGYIRSLWSDPARVKSHHTAVTKDSPFSFEYMIWAWGARIPFVRSAIGLQYYSISQPYMLGLYEKENQ